ncbi:MAG: bifunctional riboflavin kinase/FAD synthetase [Microscillaceae bacterium]
MQIYRDLTQFSPPPFAIVTSGTFDGVHVGHQKILRRVEEIRHQHGGESVVITYWPHPRLVLGKEDTNLKLLNTLDEKAALLEANGVNHLVILSFTSDFSQLSPEAFIQKIYIAGIGTKKLVIGYDHRFGKDRTGGLEYLNEHIHRYPFTVEEIPRQDIDDVGISSTKIRKALSEGNLAIAHQYLGYFYSFQGQVVHGDQLGRTIDFPTANLEIEEAYKLIPAEGIYAVRALIKAQMYEGMLYIGQRPTLAKALAQRIELHVFNFSEDIYGEVVRVWLVGHIRGDKKFDSLARMQQQLYEDQSQALTILRNLPSSLPHFQSF